MPGGEFLGEEMGEVLDGDRRFGVEGGDYGVGAIGRILDAEDYAFEDGGMGAEDGFDGFRRGFASGDVEEIGGAAVEKDETVPEFGDIGGFKGSWAESGLRFGEIGFADGGALDHESAGIGERKTNIVEG